MKLAPELFAHLQQIHRRGLLIGGLAGGLCAISFPSLREQFYPAYLAAFLYWLGLSLGCLAVAMIHGMTGGAWGRMVRRVVEAGYETLPLMAILFLPLWFGAASIYDWADPDVVQHHAVLARKAGYLNLAGFHLRAIAYFAIWMIITWALNRSSPNEERDPDSLRARRLQRVSGLGFMAYGFTFTLAAVDWMMSLEPEWYSTMYALIQIAGQGVASLCFALLVVVQLRSFLPWSRTVTSVRLNDYGNLMLASVMFWAYCSFFQYLVIWSGNLPEENVWYVRRSQAGWQYLAISLILFHFAVPFLLLLSKKIKRDARQLSRIALLLLAMHYVDLDWTVVPGFQSDESAGPGIPFHWLNIATWVAIGGFWLAVFTWRLSIRIRLPIDDPELREGKQ